MSKKPSFGWLSPVLDSACAYMASKTRRVVVHKTTHPQVKGCLFKAVTKIGIQTLDFQTAGSI